MFTTKEMKQITAKHYKKLPEVQQKLIDNKDKQIKFANRLLADMFNKVGVQFTIRVDLINFVFIFVAESKSVCLER